MSASIFIVEDERLVAEDIKLSLESHGYTVLGIASTRDQAIERIGQTYPSLVLMDIVLKGAQDGIETAAIVRARFGIPVIYLTAHADQATLRRAKISEPFGYILKPFEEHDLLSAIEIALYRHQLESRMAENERWLTAILASIDDGIIAADSMGVVKLVNSAAERIGGWDPGELTGQDLQEVFRIQEVSTGKSIELPALPTLLKKDGQIKSQRRNLVCKSGRKTLIEQSVTPICELSGTASGSVVVFRQLSPEL